MNANETTSEPSRYGPPGRDPAERPKGAKPWLLTEDMPAAWATLFANADPSGMEDETHWPVEMAERAEKRYVAEGYTFSGTVYGPHGDWKATDDNDNPLDPEPPFAGNYEGVFGDLQTFVWTNAKVLEQDLAAGKRPYPVDGSEYLLDAVDEKTMWLPACWWRLIEHGAWKTSDFEDNEDEDEDKERWGAECARDTFHKLMLEGWTPVRRLGNGYVERTGRFHGYEGTLTLYLLRSSRQLKRVPEIDQDKE